MGHQPRPVLAAESCRQRGGGAPDAAAEFVAELRERGGFIVEEICLHESSQQS